jgi:hypothetical protein
MTDLSPSNLSDFLIYQTEDGQTRLTVILEGTTVWLTQAALTELYQTTKQNISLHLKNIFTENEVRKDSTVKYFLTVQNEGGRQVQRNLEHYNLDVILAVGYRVRSIRGTQFRRWATARLSEYLVKGFVMDDERLKEGQGYDYFDELLERIRDIRASEKRFYQKIRDIYATAVDYDPNADISHTFFAQVQNKLHYAIHGHTAAELIAKRASAEKPNMGLTAWKGAKVRKRDVGVAKNYLSESELAALNRIVTMYLDYAEDQAQRRRPMHMRDWADRLDAFLQFNQREVLQDAGRVSAEIAARLADEEYAKFHTQRLKRETQQSDAELDALAKQIEEKAGRNKSDE